MAGDLRWRTVGQVGPNRPRHVCGRYEPPLNPVPDDLPELSVVELWLEYAKIVDALATVVCSDLEERLMVRRLEAITVELERRRGVS